MTDIYQRLYSAEVRPNLIFDLDTFSLDVSEVFADEYEDDPERIEEALGSKAHDGLGDLVDWIRWKEVGGVLVQMATPNPFDFHADGYRSTWAVTRVKWFHAQTLVEAYELALKWQEGIVETERVKFLRETNQ